MPILVACDCGKRFAAREHLFGRQVSCPACGNLLTVSTAGRNSAQGIFVTCTCGRAFHAPETMRGQQARCRGCGAVLQVSGPDPLGMSDVADQSLLDIPEELLAPPPRQNESEIPWDTLKLIGAVGAIVFLLVVIVTTIVNYLPRFLGGH
jgi:DNA-directed RNA polymerase subunit RPC12/RpoP